MKKNNVEEDEAKLNNIDEKPIKKLDRWTQITYLLILACIMFLFFNYVHHQNVEQEIEEMTTSMKDDGYHVIARFKNEFMYPSFESCSDKGSVIGITFSGNKTEVVDSDVKYVFCK